MKTCLLTYLTFADSVDCVWPQNSFPLEHGMPIGDVISRD